MREPEQRPVLLVSPNVAPVPGGSARLSDDLYRHLRGRLDVRLVALSSAPRADPDAHIVVGRSRVGGIHFALATLAAVLRLRPRLVHVIGWRSAVPLLFIPRRLRPPLVVHCLGTELCRAPGGLALLRDRILRQATGLVAISRHTATVTEALVDRSPFLVPPGIDLRGAVPDRLPSRNGGVRIVSVGRLDERKGHLDLVEAVAQLADRGVGAGLTIVGTGPLEGRLRQRITDLRLDEAVAVRTGASDDDVADLLAEAEVFALLTQDRPGEFEGFGIAFLEAGALGLPVVCGPSGGALEATEPGASSLVCTTPEDAADALARLAKDPTLRHELGQAGRRLAEAHAWPALADRWTLLYETLSR